ncbi:MAG: class I SAM-dependent DNA methyltransferase [Neisseria zoodegmatis]|uniref:class I SAM-dependent DNA methyltransferase n=1 Tax=Neisseria zoodegmatis TaxID=326523 RepID=UPI0026F0877F|nr:class I SAM-dependent DNA methyltransferase [Neisseria zoodegmatis]MDO5069688.1 class I SAM-dependent DNA methyltransferase [Neisseria zoodegmatis]
MSLNTFVKSIQNIMRGDAGINGDAQRIEQMTWLLFLKIYGNKEQNWALIEDGYQSIIPDEYQWENWAIDHKDGHALTGDALLRFVDQELIPALKSLRVTEHTQLRQRIVRDVFEDAKNFMKNGTLLRQLINEIDAIDFDSSKERHAFGDIYETILKSLQSAGNAGEFYTPRAVTDFMVQVIDPQLGESIADFASGTGGFLVSALNRLEPQVKTVADRQTLNASLHGVEKKPLPHLLAITNLLLHDIDSPQIRHGNALEHNVRDYGERDRHDIILMNPPYGGTELNIIKQNFPAELRSSETADLFIALALYRLKAGGRAAIIIPDSFLFGNDGAKTALKNRLLTDFDLHTIVRLPSGVFAPYTSITTNILFFNKPRAGETPSEKLWFYHVNIPNGWRAFSKTRPFLPAHLADCIDWWHNRTEIQDSENSGYQAKAFDKAELLKGGCNLDLCGYTSDEAEILSLEEAFRQYEKGYRDLERQINESLKNISDLLGFDLNDLNQGGE